MALHQLDEIARGITCQGRFGEVRVGGEKIVGAGVEIGEVAAATSRDQDLAADLPVVLQHHHRAASLAGFYGAHQAGGAGADYHYIRIGHALIFAEPRVPALAIRGARRKYG